METINKINGVTLRRDMILVGPLPTFKKSGSELVVVTEKEQPIRRGMVLDVGPGIKDKKGNLISLPCAPGDRIMYTLGKGNHVRISDETLHIISSEDVILKLEE